MGLQDLSLTEGLVSAPKVPDPRTRDPVNRLKIAPKSN